MSYIGNTVQNQNYVPAIDYFNGDGSTVAFTLSRPVASVAAVQAVISNVPQNPGSAFSVSGSTITFTSAPPSGTANIYVYYTSPNTQVVQPGQGTVGTTQLADASVTSGKLASTTGTGAVALASLPKFTTTIGVGGTTPAASGSGITFPATQSASSDANTLDDYEEGTWTPTQGSGLTVVGAFSSSGSYTKVGRVVTVRGVVGGATSVAIGANGIVCAGLPFNCPLDMAGSMFNNSLNASTVVDAAANNVYSAGTIAATPALYFTVTYFTTT